MTDNEKWQNDELKFFLVFLAKYIIFFVLCLFFPGSLIIYLLDTSLISSSQVVHILAFLSFVSVCIAVIFLSKFLGREHPIKILSSIIVIYSLLAFIIAYEENKLSFNFNIQELANILTNKVDTQAPNLNIQNTPEQKIANARIEKFILGTEHWRDKITIDIITPNENGSLERSYLSVIADTYYKAEKTSNGLYKITKDFKLSNHNYHGNQKIVALLKSTDFGKEKFTVEYIVYSNGDSLISIADDELSGCYPITDGNCNYKKSSIEVKKILDSSSQCECQSYKSYKGNPMTYENGTQCTVTSCNTTNTDSMIVINDSVFGIKYEPILH